MNRKELKKCAIQGCTNVDSGPDRKFFYCAPKSYATRGLWMMACGKVYAHSTNFFVCQDHFDLTKDVDYVHHVTGKPVLLKFISPTLKLDGNNPLSENVQAEGKPLSHANMQAEESVGTNSGVPVHSGTDPNKLPQPNMLVTENSGVSIQTDTDPNKLQFFRPLKRKVIDLTPSTPSTSGEKSDEVSRKDVDFEMSQSDLEYQSSEESDSAEEEEDEDSRLLNSDDEDVSNEENIDNEESRLMCKLTIQVMERNIQHYTGIPEESRYVIDLIEKSGVIKRDVMLVLRKIRHNETFQILGDAFGISRSQAGAVFRVSLPKIAVQLKAFVYWPGATSIRRNLPLQFKHKYRNVQAIIDCWEISIAKPSTPLDQALTYSSYKHSNTMKYLIASTPDGFIIFISKGFAGRISDNEIVKRSGFLEFIKKDTEVLADRGFKDVGPDIMSKGGILIKPPSTQAGMVFTAEEAAHCKTVAAIRIHIERVIGRLRNFVFLKPQNSLLNRKRSYLLQHAVTVACGICNMQGFLTKI